MYLHLDHLCELLLLLWPATWWEQIKGGSLPLVHGFCSCCGRAWQTGQVPWWQLGRREWDRKGPKTIATKTYSQWSISFHWALLLKSSEPSNTAPLPRDWSSIQTMSLMRTFHSQTIRIMTFRSQNSIQCIKLTGTVINPKYKKFLLAVVGSEFICWQGIKAQRTEAVWVVGVSTSSHPCSGATDIWWIYRRERLSSHEAWRGCPCPSSSRCPHSADREHYVDATVFCLVLFSKYLKRRGESSQGWGGIEGRD